MALTAVVLACFFTVALSQGPTKPPTYPNTYRTSGSIKLPYAEIVEPFFALYDGPNQRSRVDYYGGIQKTMQFGKTSGFPYGTSYKVIPFTTQSVYNKVSCFMVNGSEEATMDIVNVLPDLTNFTYIGRMEARGKLCDAYQQVVTVGKKVSTYTFYATMVGAQPWRYEMFGYDSLLGSHFDKYYVDYDEWMSPSSFDPQEFQVTNNVSCTSFPGPGNSAERNILMNPISEYVHRKDQHIHQGFEQFKHTHKRAYKAHEHDTRLNVFRQNLRFIHSKNRAGLSYTMAVNHLADHTEKEMKIMRGFRYTHGNRGGQTYKASLMTTVKVPDQWDWRLKGAVTPVKDQAICGSCWSFGTTGTIEGANFLKTGNLVRLSQQELIDCSWGFGNDGCDGGEDFRAYKWMMENGGLTSYEQYGQYLAIDGFCKMKEVKPVVQISNYTTLPQGDLNALKLAIFNKGPISVAIDASHKSLGFYANGVYYEPQCKSGPDDLDHAVLAVGYGTMNGQAYWLVKNSWSTYWGNDGYVLMSQKDNNCGVATDATYVDIK